MTVGIKTDLINRIIWRELPLVMLDLFGYAIYPQDVYVMGKVLITNEIQILSSLTTKPIPPLPIFAIMYGSILAALLTCIVLMYFLNKWMYKYIAHIIKIKLKGLGALI